ncbi:hypothetical protein F4553_006391 [Allocatelliglobosispora scoriae]|uniref:Uncharacterized protein n=1 Tax=Allocatelliglobosispora scoriae TaxID=643052 RepID=A0A841BV28_9ACTN|nr:hypothetical protein [Allocatelliglobosispora scoriae]MBB5872957.1 hypothetical protein [Allocatelliglobosispora scoriae]
MKFVDNSFDIRCDHDGKVQNNPSQHWVEIAGHPVLVDDDPQNRAIVRCPNIGATMKPCVKTLRVAVGYSEWIRIDGQAVVLDTLDGLTDGTVPGTVHYRVRIPGQSFVEENS